MIVLDAWAIVAHLKGEPAAPRIEDAWAKGGAAACSVNLGEILYLESRRRDERSARRTIEAVRRELAVIDPDWPLVVAAAGIKAGGGLSYADAFCVATAQRLGAPLWTGDPEILALDAEVELVDLR